MEKDLQVEEKSSRDTNSKSLSLSLFFFFFFLSVWTELNCLNLLFICEG